MANDNKVELEITAETSKAEKSLRDFEKSAEKSVGSISSSFKALGAVAAAAVAFVAGREVISFLTDSTKAAADNEAQIAKLEASLKSVGDFTPQVVEDFKDFADQLETTSKFSDDAALAQIAFAKQLGLSNDEAKQLVQAAADLASVTGDTLETAVAELGRTLTGTAGALGKTIPEVKSFSEEQLKAGAAVDLVAERLKGAARNAIQTYQGSLIQLANSQEDFQKSVGSIITQNPALISVIQSSTRAFGSLQGLIDDNKESISAFITAAIQLVADAMPLIIDSFGVALKVVAGLTKTFSILTFAAADAASAFLSFDVVQQSLSATINGIQTLLGSLTKALGLFVEGLAAIPGVSGFFKEVGIDIDSVKSGLNETADSLFDLSTKDVDFTSTINGLNSIRDGAAEFSVEADDAFKSAQGGIESLSKAAKKAAKDIANSDSSIAKAAKEAAIAQEVAGQASVKASVEASKAKSKALGEEKDQNKEREDLAKNAQGFIDKIFSKEAASIKKVELERKKDLEDLSAYVAQGAIAQERYEDLRQSIIDDSEKKIENIRRQNLDNFKKDISDIASSPFKVFVSEIDVDLDALKSLAEVVNSGLGGISTILKGGAGAESLVKSAASALGDALIPGLGPIVGEITGVLAQGPEKVRALVDEFAAALPGIITNIVKSVPVIIDALVDAAPRLVKEILAALPELIGGLVDAIPEIVQGFIDALPEFISALADGMPEVATALADAMPEVAVALAEAGPKIAEGFIEEMVFKGGAVKVAVAMVRAAFDPSIMIRAGQNISIGFVKTATGVGIAESFLKNIGEPLQSLFTGIGGSLTLALSNTLTASSALLSEDILRSFTSGASQLAQGFSSGISNLSSSLTSSLASIGSSLSGLIGSSITEGFSTALASVKGVFQGAFDLLIGPIDSIRNIFKRVFGDKIKDLENVLLRPINILIDFLDNFKFPEIKIGGQSGLPKTGNKAVDDLAKVQTIITTGGISAFAAQGGIVPKGFPNDTFGAGLTTDEMILPPRLSLGIQDLIDKGQSGSDDSELMLAVLSELVKISNLLGQPMQVETTAEVDGRSFAKIILDLNRQNARLTA